VPAASNDRELETAFSVMHDKHVGGLVIAADPFANKQDQGNRRAGAALRPAGDLRQSAIHNLGRPDELRQSSKRTGSPAFTWGGY